jgi:hypothetical protein
MIRALDWAPGVLCANASSGASRPTRRPSATMSNKQLSPSLPRCIKVRPKNASSSCSHHLSPNDGDRRLPYLVLRYAVTVVSRSSFIPFAGRSYIFRLQASPPNILGVPWRNPIKIRPAQAFPPMNAYTGGLLMFILQPIEVCTLLTILLSNYISLNCDIWPSRGL